MRRKIIRMNIITIVIIAIILHHNVYGLSPELNYPRIGDELTLFELKNVPSFEKDKPQTDLSKAVTFAKNRFKVYEPAREDSLSSMIIVQGKRTSLLAYKGSLLFEKGYYQPGEKRMYEGGIIYEAYVPDSLTIQTVCSDGNISGTGSFSSAGRKTIMRDSHRSIITMEGDTLNNLEYSEAELDEIFIYAATDTVKHHGVQSRWYAAGYRYPILTYTDSYIITLENDTVDRIVRWEAAPPAQQEEKIKDDPLNELIRNIRDVQDRTPGNGTTKNTTYPDNSPRQTGNFEWNPSTGEITLSMGISRDVLSEYVLCDIHGRVFSAGRLDNADNFSISLANYPPGVYVFGYNTNDEFNCFRITKL